MGIFSRSVDPDELRASMSEERITAQETVYQASRGGHYPAAEKPVAGTPQEGPRAS